MRTPRGSIRGVGVRLDLLGPEIGADHALVAQHLGGRAGGRAACRSPAPRSSRSTPTPGSCRGRRGSSARRSARGSGGSPRRGARSPRPAARPRARRAAPAAACRRRARATSTSRRSRAPSVPTLALGSTSIPTNEIAPSTSSRRERSGQLGVLVDHRHVVVDRQLLDRLLGLERPPHAPAGAAEVGHLQQVLAERLDRSRRPG